MRAVSLPTYTYLVGTCEGSSISVTERNRTVRVQPFADVHGVGEHSCRGAEGWGLWYYRFICSLYIAYLKKMFTFLPNYR